MSHEAKKEVNTEDSEIIDKSIIPFLAHNFSGLAASLLVIIKPKIFSEL